MTQREQKMVYPLYNLVRGKRASEVVDYLWREGLLNRVAVERRYFAHEIERQLREGEVKSVAMAQLACEARCSYEKVRHAIYKTNSKKRK